MMMVLSSSYFDVLSNKNLVSISPLSSLHSTLDHFHGSRRIRNIRRRRPLTSRCELQLSDVSSAASSAASAYGALLLAGGLFAYSRSGSKGSLIGGLVGSSSMAAAFVLMQSPETKPIGDSLAFGSALLFTFVFGIRLAATRKVVPAGPLLGLSVAALAVFVSAYLQDTQSLSNVM